MNYRWKRTAIVFSALLVAGMAAAAAPEEAHGAAKSETLRVYVDGAKSQLQAQQVDGKAYISASGAESLGVTMRAGGNGANILEFGKQSVQVSKGDAVTINKELHVPVASVAEAMKARWISDRLTGSLFVFQRSKDSSSSAAGSSTPPLSSLFPELAVSGAASQPAPGDTVSVSDAKPTLAGIVIGEDSITISSTGEIKPNVFQLREPDRIVIDLSGTSLEPGLDGKAGGTIPVNTDHPYVSGVRYSLFAVQPATARIVLDMKSAAAFRVETAADGTSITVRFGVEQQRRIMIDAGHGGHDPGAVSKSGKYEKDLTLAVARKAVVLLEQEKLLAPVPVRMEDIYSSPAERAQIANQNGIDMYISIHANTASSSSVRGTETYYWRDNSQTLAETIHAYVLEAVGSSDRKVKKNNFIVIRETSMPAVLLELGFLTNLDDEKKLYDENVQDKIAAAIVASIKQYYGITATPN